MMTPYVMLLEHLNEPLDGRPTAVGRRKRAPMAYAPINALPRLPCKRPYFRRTITLIRLLPGTNEDTQAEVAAILWRGVSQEQNLNLAFQYYLSFLSVMLPELKNEIEVSINYLGHILAFNDFPGTSAYEEYADNDTQPMELKQARVYLGVSLLVPFKNITGENYSGYFSRRIAAICNIVGVDIKTMGMPFSVEKCNFFKLKMNQFHTVRKKIVEILVSRDADAMAEAQMSNVTRYVMLMIVWTEMTGFFFVMEALVSSVSPVLFCMELRNETNKFFDIAENVFAIDHPALYRYLAPEENMVSVSEYQFPILFAVSYRVLGRKHKSISQLVRPSNVNDNLVQKYLRLHYAYVSRTTMIPKQVESWIPYLIDPDIKRLAIQMRHNNLTGDQLIQPKAFSPQRYTSAAASGMRDSYTAKSRLQSGMIAKRVEGRMPDLIDPDIKRSAFQMRHFRGRYTSAAASGIRDSHTAKSRFLSATEKLNN